jgi:hypothetical protein
LHGRAPSPRKRFAPDLPRCRMARHWRGRAAEVAHPRLKSMPSGCLFVSWRYLRLCSFPGPRRRRLVFLCFSLGSALTADSHQHFLLSRCGLAWPLALCWFRPTVICDAAFQGIHQVDYVFALWPRAFAAMGLPLRFSRNSSRAFARREPEPRVQERTAAAS